MGTSLSPGTVDPILGVYEGVQYRPLYNDYCRHYVKDFFGVKVPTDVGCQSTRCAAEGNCPAASPVPQQPQYQMPMQPQGQWVAGVDNNIVLIVIGGLVLVVITFLIWRK